jgi:hypothetical protein
MGFAALIQGIKGVRNAREHPEVKGKVHAWVGIITGGLFGLCYLILTLFMLVALLPNQGRR